MSVPFAAGTGGYHTYRIPALAVVSGVVLAFAEGRVNGAGDGGDTDVLLRRSLDGGDTWEPAQAVAEHGTDTAANATVVVDPASGDVVLLTCRSGGDDTSWEIRTGAAPPRRVYVQRSDDAGATWSPPDEISTQVRPAWMRHYGTGPGHGVAIAAGPHAGRLVAPCWHTRTPSGADTGAETKYYGAHLVYSDDGGATWALGASSSNGNGVINENESTLTELADGAGTLYATCRRLSDERPGHRADAYSVDGGASFAQAYRVQATLPLPTCQGAVITLPDGRLLHSGPTHPEERAGMGLWLSSDAGRTWRLAHRVTGLCAAYSDLALLDAATVGLLYETGDWGPYERIELARVPISELN